MSANRNLARLPVAAISGAFSTIITALRGNTGDVLDLQPAQVSLRFFSLLRSSYPTLEKFLNMSLPILLLSIGLWRHFTFLKDVKNGVQKLHSSLLCHLTIAGSADLNQLICTYLSDRGIGKDSRNLAITEDDISRDSGSTSLNILPAPSADSWFKFNGKWLRFTRAAKKESQNGYASADPDITLSCFSLTGNSKPIQDFIEHIVLNHRAKHHAQLRIMQFRGGGGSFTIYKAGRKLDSVSMKATTKKVMVDDMQSYLDSEDWYANRGIPYRRGYLLYGPPGTGKTSIATAIAGHFNLPLIMFVLSDPKLTDAILLETFQHMPRRCIVLIEDIDCAGIGREKVAKSSENQDTSSDSDSDSDSDDTLTSQNKSRASSAARSSQITLSGLLNAIDGATSQEGRILLCTTNSPDSLDAALIRPGCIDMKILFGNADAEVTESLFSHIFEGTAEETALAQMAKTFATLIPDDQLTPAEIQNFLLQHRGNPSKVLDGAEAWVKDLLATKNKGGNVASFKGQI